MSADLIRQLAIRQGPAEERIGLYTWERVQDKWEKVDISCDGRFYITFRSASGTAMAALDAATGRARLVNRVGESGTAEQVIEFSDWPTVEVAIRHRLIVEACLPCLTESGDLGEYRIDTSKNPGQIAKELDTIIGRLLPIVATMIRDYYYGRVEEEATLTQVVEEAGNS